MNPADEIESYQPGVLADMELALLDACRTGDLTTVKRLSKTGFFDLNEQLFGYTPLWWACRYDNPEIVEYLIEEEKVKILQDEMMNLLEGTTYVKVFCGLNLRVKYSLTPRFARDIVRTLLFITETQYDTPEIALLKATVGDIFPIILDTIMQDAFRIPCSSIRYP